MPVSSLSQQRTGPGEAEAVRGDVGRQHAGLVLAPGEGLRGGTAVDPEEAIRSNFFGYRAFDVMPDGSLIGIVRWTESRSGRTFAVVVLNLGEEVRARLSELPR